MARTTKELSATAVEKAKAGPKDYRLYDGKGLFLLVTCAILKPISDNQLFYSPPTFCGGYKYC